MNRRSIQIATLMAISIFNGYSQSFGRSEAAGPAAAASNSLGGIRTDRLDSRQMQTWKAIERLIQAVDPAGNPQYPRLFGLFRWAQGSPSPIFIEMSEEKHPKTYHAGFLTVQEPSAGNARMVAVLQLWPRIIDTASTDEANRRADGFLPFAQLGRLERYAEVVGHELVHAALHLKNPAYAQVCRDLESEKAAFLASKKQNRQGNGYDQETLERLARIRSLTERVEAPAQAAEVEIWKELLNGQKARTAANRQKDLSRGIRFKKRSRIRIPMAHPSPQPGRVRRFAPIHHSDGGRPRNATIRLSGP